MSRYQIAQSSGVSEAALSRFVNGHSSLTLASADKLAKVLDLTVVTGTSRKTAKSS